MAKEAGDTMVPNLEGEAGPCVPSAGASAKVKLKAGGLRVPRLQCILGHRLHGLLGRIATDCPACPFWAGKRLSLGQRSPRLLWG